MKCWICGKEATKTRMIGTNDGFSIRPFSDYKQRCYCEECFSAVMEQRSKDLKEYARLKKKVMFERAVDLLEHQNLDLYKFREAIKAVEDYAAEQPDKFDSAYEMIAAIMLIQNRVRCKPQYKVGKYQVDFLLLDEYIVLEIDGERHKHRKDYDSERDKAIKAELGEEWEIIRIKTDYIDKHADRLVEAVRRVAESRIFGYK